MVRSGTQEHLDAADHGDRRVQRVAAEDTGNAGDQDVPDDAATDGGEDADQDRRQPVQPHRIGLERPGRRPASEGQDIGDGEERPDLASPDRVARLSSLLEPYDKVYLSAEESRRDEWITALKATGIGVELVVPSQDIYSAVGLGRLEEADTLILSRGPLSLSSQIKKRAFDLALTVPAPLPIVVLGIGIVTIGFFGAHSIASSWVGRRSGADRAQAAAFYLFFYYLGSSILGSAGGFAWTHGGWPGVAGFCGVLTILALAVAATRDALRAAGRALPKT